MKTSKSISNLFHTLPFTLLLCSCGSGLSDGASIASVTPTITRTSPHKIFVLSSPTASGDLKTIGGGATGALGADAICQTEAAANSITTAKAMLVSSTRIACTSANCVTGGASEHTDWVLAANQAYVRADGTTSIGTTTSAGIFSFPLTNSITAGASFNWTGMATDWTNNTDNCTNWTDPTAGSNGMDSRGALSTSGAIGGNGPVGCNAANRTIYCVEQ